MEDGARRKGEHDRRELSKLSKSAPQGVTPHFCTHAASASAPPALPSADANSSRNASHNVSRTSTPFPAAGDITSRGSTPHPYGADSGAELASEFAVDFGAEERMEDGADPPRLLPTTEEREAAGESDSSRLD